MSKKVEKSICHHVWLGKNRTLLLIDINCWLEDKALQDRPPNVYKSLFGFVTKFVDQIKKSVNNQTLPYGL